MNQYDVGDAITWGYKGPTSRNFLFRLILWTVVLFLIVYAIFGRGFISGYAEFLQMAFEIEQSDDPEAALEIFGMMGKWISSMILMSLALWAVFASAETAFHKNVLHGIDHGMVPLRFGKLELSVMLVQLVVYLCASAAYIGGAILLMVLVMIGALLGSVSEALGIILAVLIGVIGLFGLIAAIIMVAVRLSPAAAMTVRDNQIRIFEPWKMTKPVFWPMLGGFLIVGLVGYVLIYVVMMIFILIAFGDLAVLTALSGVSEDNPNEIFDALKEVMTTPRVMISLILGTIAYSATMLLWYIGIWGVANMAVKLDGET